MGRRIWKEQYRDANAVSLAQAKRTIYLYADEGLIAEATQAITVATDASGVQTVTASAAPAITTQYGPTPNSPFGTGALFIKTKNSNNTDTVAYYHHDHLQTPIQGTDKAGNIVWAASYDAFGKASIITPVATVDKPTIESNLRLPGQYEDQETGLHYNYFRYYDTQTGRYISQDPIGLAGGVNMYGYVMANPIGNIDPRGQRCQTTGSSVTCQYPGGGPNITFPRPANNFGFSWPDTIERTPTGPGSDYHSYDKDSNSTCRSADLMRNIISSPTPGLTSTAATPGGTPNYATPPNLQMAIIAGASPFVGIGPAAWAALHMNPVRSYIVNDNLSGQQYVVNVTQPGHGLFPGYVARTVMDNGDGTRTLHNYGEGQGPLQSERRWTGFMRDPINDGWYGMNDANTKKAAKNSGCDC